MYVANLLHTEFKAAAAQDQSVSRWAAYDLVWRDSYICYGRL